MAIQPLELLDHSYRFQMSYEYQLEDTKQILIEYHNYTTQHNNGNWVHVKQDKKKAILTEIHYQYETETNEFSIEYFVIQGFRKDKKIRARKEWVNAQSNWTPKELIQEILAQIPDNYHDQARQAFAQMTDTLQKRLTDTINKGVVIK